MVLIEALEPDDTGGSFPVETWRPQGYEYMARNAERSRERFQNDQLISTGRNVWNVRYRRDLDPDLVDVKKMRRLHWKGKIHDIVDADFRDWEHGIDLETISSGAIGQ